MKRENTRKHKKRGIWNRVISVTVTVAMIISVTPQTVYAGAEEIALIDETQNETAEENFEYTENDDGTVTIKKYTGSDTEVIIPNIIDGKSVTIIGNYAFSKCSKLKSVKIQSGVTEIGTYAFNRCVSLTDIEIPSGVTTMGYGAFYKCESLTDIEIPTGITSIMGSTFEACSGLTYIEIPTGVTVIENSAFSRCSSLKTVEIPMGVTSLGEKAFSSCSGLTGIRIPSDVTSIGSSAFSNCNKLTVYCDEDSYARQYATENSITCLSFDEWEETQCPHSNTELRNVVKSTCTAEGYSGDTYCNDCGRIIKNGASVTKLGHSYTKKVTKASTLDEEGEITYTCSNCEYAYTEVTEKLKYLDYTDNEDGTITITKYNGNDTDVKITDKIDGKCVTGIGSWAFGNCESLESVEIPTGVTSIGECAFSGCSALSSITVPSGVISIGKGAFAGCTGLTDVELSSGITEIGTYAFMSCTALTSIEIPSSVTSIGDYAFGACTGLTSIKIQPDVTSIGFCAFDSCSKLTIYCQQGSYAEQYATNNNISCKSFEEWNQLKCLHVNTELRAVTEATCVESGYSGDRYCRDCGMLISEGKEVNALEHSYVGAVTEPATVRLEGMKTYTCERCGDVYTEVIPKLICQHSNTEVKDKVTATCTTAGYTGDAYCNDCEQLISEGETAAALEHSYIGVVTKEATSDSEGEMTYTCDKCGEAYTEVIEKLKIFIYEENDDGTISITKYNGSDSEVIIPDRIDGKVVTGISGGAFQRFGDATVTSISIPATVTDIGTNAFLGCTEMVSISLPSSIKTIGDSAFARCYSLTSIEIPCGVTSIGGGAFVDCYSLKSIEIPSGVAAIGSILFFNCYNLTSIKIPSSVTSIGERAFYGCSSLTDIRIPSGVTDMADSVFENCSNLTIYCSDNSCARQYEAYENISYKSLEDWEAEKCAHTETELRGVVEPTCTAEGYSGDTYCKEGEIIISKGYSVAKKLHTDEDRDGKCDNCDTYMDGIGAKLAGYSLSLSGNIGVNFYMELSDEVVEDGDAYMNFTLPNGTTTQMKAADAVKKAVNDKEYYVFSCEVSAKEMTDDITAQMVVDDRTGTKYTYTVKEYADFIIDNAGTFGDSAVTLAKAMLNYGANVQKYFTYNVNDLANCNLLESDKTAYSDITDDYFDGYGAKITGDKDICSFVSAYLTLKSETDICVYVKTAENVNPAEVEFVITENESGACIDTIKASDMTTELIDGNVCYKLTVRDISAQKLDTMYDFKVTVGSGDDAQTATLTYGAYSYGKTAMSEKCDGMDNIDTLRSTLRAMVAYHNAAQTY